VAKKGYTTPGSATKPISDDIGDVIDLVKTYAKQETLGPLKGIGRKIGLGLAGALSLGVGLLLISLGLLRLVQTKIPRIAQGAWSWVPYCIVFTFCVLVTAFALSRISKIEKELN
jgi:hypothetical protein